MNGFEKGRKMKSTRKYWATVLLLVCIVNNSIFAQNSVTELSLDDCIKIGLTQSLRILRSKDSLQITDAALLGAYGQFLPDLNLNGSYGYLNGSNLLTTTGPTLVNST